MIRLDIFSDPVCPWCLIGKTHLDCALESRALHPFRIEWHPYQLNPGMPPEGMDGPEFMEMRFGSRAAAVALYARVDAAAREAGLEIDFAGLRRMPNTLDAHRLIHWAGIEGRQTAMVSALFRAYFREARDIGDRVVVATIAEEVGMDALAVAIALKGDADRDDLAARDADARAKGVTGVPAFLIDRHHLVAGAQPVAFWQEVIDDVAAQLERPQ